MKEKENENTPVEIRLIPMPKGKGDKKQKNLLLRLIEGAINNSKSSLKKLSKS